VDAGVQAAGVEVADHLGQLGGGEKYRMPEPNRPGGWSPPGQV